MNDTVRRRYTHEAIRLLISLQGKTNLFEKGVSDHSKANTTSLATGTLMNFDRYS